MLTVVMLNLVALLCRYADCSYAECRYAERRGISSIFFIVKRRMNVHCVSTQA
jgi:hypothetical protein